MRKILHADFLNAYRSLYSQARRVGNEWKGPCPACGGTDRFWLHVRPAGDGGAQIGCRQCEPGRRNPDAYKAILRALGLDAAAPSVEFEAERQRRQARAREGERLEREHKVSKALRQVRELIQTSGPVVTDSPAWRYLVEVRKCWPKRWQLPACVRWILWQNAPDFVRPRRTCAGLLLFVADGGRVLAQTETLQANGRRTEPRQRRTTGLGKADMLTLHGASNRLHVCEGPVTALALFRAYGGTDSVACTFGTSGLKGDAVWDHARRFDEVRIHAEADAAGREGADALMDRLPDTAQIMRYPSGKDAADLVRARVLGMKGKAGNTALTQPTDAP